MFLAKNLGWCPIAPADGRWGGSTLLGHSMSSILADRFKHPLPTGVRMAITILAVVGIWSDARPNEIHKPAH